MIKYGDKRDYRKIDLYAANGEYIASTTWARSCREAVKHCPGAARAAFAKG